LRTGFASAFIGGWNTAAARTVQNRDRPTMVSVASERRIVAVATRLEERKDNVAFISVFL
jgi:hypothetical protein